MCCVCLSSSTTRISGLALPIAYRQHTSLLASETEYRSRPAVMRQPRAPSVSCAVADSACPLHPAPPCDTQRHEGPGPGPRRVSAPISTGLVKVTFYIEPRDLAALEHERDRRRLATGRRRGVDLSALVREAIRASFGWAR